MRDLGVLGPDKLYYEAVINRDSELICIRSSCGGSSFLFATSCRSRTAKTANVSHLQHVVVCTHVEFRLSKPSFYVTTRDHA